MDMRTAISNMDMRTGIIRIFEWLCLFGVYLATTIGVVVGGLAGGLLFAVIGGVGAFLVSAFVTGGALTLLDIGDSLHRLVEIEEKRDAESAPRQQLLT
jgi:hypothetical protein